VLTLSLPYYSGDAEANLERLHQCAEKDLNQFLSDDPAAPTDMTFTEFKTKLAGLTTYALIPCLISTELII
jgi:ariadne-1